MSKQWKATTRGGHDYRITTRDPDSDLPIRGEVEDSGFVVYVQWTEGGRVYLDAESPYDLIPIEAEATSPAKVRVDLALAAYAFRAAVVEFQRAEDAKDKLGKAMFEAFAAAGMLDAVVKIEGDHYHFFASEGTTRFRKIEVL
jgi:hypothetical protein